MVSTEDISWTWHSKPFHHEFLEVLTKATSFGDAPWNHLYPLYDQLLPENHTKFILTVRDSTRDQVNSNMKMFARQYIKRMKSKGRVPMEEDIQYDYTNFTMSAGLMGVQYSWKDFWTMNARNYETHNRKVQEYFKKRGRLKDLLVINLAEESRKEGLSEQWWKITNFLGCPNVTNKPLPRENAGDRELEKKQKGFMDYQIRIMCLNMIIIHGLAK